MSLYSYVADSYVADSYLADGDAIAEDELLQDMQITHGNPTAEELAIVAALVTASGRAVSALVEQTSTRSAWAQPARRLRRPLPAGGWRLSARR